LIIADLSADHKLLCNQLIFLCFYAYLHGTFADLVFIGSLAILSYPLALCGANRLKAKGLRPSRGTSKITAFPAEKRLSAVAALGLKLPFFRREPSVILLALASPSLADGQGFSSTDPQATKGRGRRLARPPI